MSQAQKVLEEVAECGSPYISTALTTAPSHSMRNETCEFDDVWLKRCIKLQEEFAELEHGTTENVRGVLDLGEPFPIRSEYGIWKLHCGEPGNDSEIPRLEE